MKILITRFMLELQPLQIYILELSAESEPFKHCWLSLSVILNREDRGSLFFPSGILVRETPLAREVTMGPHMDKSTGKNTKPTSSPHDTIAKKATKRV